MLMMMIMVMICGAPFTYKMHKNKWCIVEVNKIVS